MQITRNSFLPLQCNMCNYLINKIILKLVSAEDNQTAGQREQRLERILRKLFNCEELLNKLSSQISRNNNKSGDTHLRDPPEDHTPPRWRRIRLCGKFSRSFRSTFLLIISLFGSWNAYTRTHQWHESSVRRTACNCHSAIKLPSHRVWLCCRLLRRVANYFDSTSNYCEIFPFSYLVVP